MTYGELTKEIERKTDEFESRIVNLEKVNSEINSEVIHQVMGGKGNGSLFAYNYNEDESKEMKRQLELLSLDSSLESIRKRNQLVADEVKKKVVDKVANVVTEKVKQELVNKIHNGISVKRVDAIKSNNNFTIIEELKIRIILWFMSKIDNEYLQEKLESKLLSFRRGEI